MKIKPLFIAAILLQLSAVSYFAQNAEIQPESILIDSFSYTNSEDMKARIDNFTVQMQNNPSVKGYVVIKGKNPARITAEKDIKNYLEMRAFDMKNVVFLNGEGDKTAKIDLWLVPPGAKPPAPKKAVDQASDKLAMEAKALTALVEELKGVVSRTAPDKNEAKLVGEKWDARKDLNGKTKSEVIELLFEDVKSAIKDSGIQYQIYSIFSFYKTIADDSPTDKPMEAKALAALVKGLKGVITRYIPDKKEANLIIKWDARKDLAGKSKKDVIRMLFDDFRSVIKDFDTRYAIFTMFSFYEAIPDDSFTEQTQKTESEMSKSELVEELVRQTLKLNYSYGKPEYPRTPEEKQISDILEKNDRIEGYEEALKQNDKLTPKQKDFVRANYDKLLEMETKIDAEAEKTSYEQSANQWVEESLRKSYTKFSPEELRSLIASFTGIKGQRYLENLNRFTFAESFSGSLDNLGYPKAQIAEYKKFVESELGKKFLTANFVEVQAYMKSLEEAENSKNPDEDESLNFLQRINKIINKFVEENYKT